MTVSYIENLWTCVHANFTEPQIVDAIFVITMYIMVSKFGDAFGEVLKPILEIEHEAT